MELNLHTNSMDEALWLPTEKSVQVALRTQQSLVLNQALPIRLTLAGSYLVEYLTDEIENKLLNTSGKLMMLVAL